MAYRKESSYWNTWSSRLAQGAVVLSANVVLWRSVNSVVPYPYDEMTPMGYSTLR